VGSRVGRSHHRVRRHDRRHTRAAAGLEPTVTTCGRNDRAGSGPSRAQRDRCSIRERITSGERSPGSQCISWRIARRIEYCVNRSEAERVADSGQHAFPIGTARLLQRTARDGDCRAERARGTDRVGVSIRIDFGVAQRVGIRGYLTLAKRIDLGQSEREYLCLAVAERFRLARSERVSVSLAQRIRLGFAEPVRFVVSEPVAFGIHFAGPERISVSIAKCIDLGVAEPVRFVVSEPVAFGIHFAGPERVSVCEPVSVSEHVAVTKRVFVGERISVGVTFAVGERDSISEPVSVTYGSVHLAG
jgi:hypothetical protein